MKQASQKYIYGIFKSMHSFIHSSKKFYLSIYYVQSSGMSPRGEEWQQTGHECVAYVGGDINSCSP